MAEDYISKILRSEEKAKHIISDTASRAKKIHTDTVNHEREALKQEEMQRRANALDYLAQLQSNAESKLNALAAAADEISDKSKSILEGHKSHMIRLVTEYITGKAQM